MWSRPGRKTHSDRPGEDEAQKALRPLGPTDEAIKPQAPDRSTNGERSTPNVSRVSSGRGDQPQPLNGVRRQKGLSLQPPNVPGGRRAYHSNPPDEAEDEGLITPSIRPMLPAKGFITPHRQHPSWATFSVQPGLEGKTPRFLGRETLEKPETASIITAADTRWKGLT